MVYLNIIILIHDKPFKFNGSEFKAIQIKIAAYNVFIIAVISCY